MADFVNNVFFLSLLLIAFRVPGVSAFDAGDILALVLGLVVSILGICACLGYYARRRNLV